MYYLDVLLLKKKMHEETKHTDSFKYQHGNLFLTEVLQDTEASGLKVL